MFASRTVLPGFPPSCRPSTIARVLPDGSAQITRLHYNDRGNILYRIDPLGRETRYEYAKNGIDLVKVQQKNGPHTNTLTQLRWDTQHRPLTIKDAAGQSTHYTWNEAGQLTSRVSPLGGVTRYEYDRQGRLSKIINALSRDVLESGQFTGGEIGRKGAWIKGFREFGRNLDFRTLFGEKSWELHGNIPEIPGAAGIKIRFEG